MEGIEEYTNFVTSIKKEIDVPLKFRTELYKYFGSKVTGLSYEEYESGMVRMLTLRKQVFDLLINSKIFVLEPNIAKLLHLTDNQIFKREIPFDNFFLETSFELEDGSMVKGIHIFKEPKEGVILGVVRIYNNSIPIPATIHFDLFAEKHEIMDSKNKLIDSMQKSSPIAILKDKKIQLFICNFLDFLNDPEVEIRTIARTPEQNLKRIGRGKLPIPPISYIKVNGKLKIYQSQLENKGHFSYSHKFWVRGHFRTLRSSKRYGKGVGKRIWIKPYIKGEGILLSKNYKLNTEEAVSIPPNLKRIGYP